MQCSGMQGLYALLTGEDLSSFYIYICSEQYARPVCLIDWGGCISLLYIHQVTIDNFSIVGREDQKPQQSNKRSNIHKGQQSIPQ